MYVFILYFSILSSFVLNSLGVIFKENKIWTIDNIKTYIAIFVKEYNSIVDPKTIGVTIFTIVLKIFFIEIYSYL